MAEPKESTEKIVSKYDDINLGILKYIKENQKILDIGCGTGLLDKEIKKKNNIVYGIDISKERLKIAKKRLDRVFRQDVNQINIPSHKFDVLIFADILEHLENPLLLLRTSKKYLKKDGYIIVSIPNVVVWNIRLKFLFGSFTYKESGTLDKSHLRFFTKKTALELVNNAGYKIKKVDTTPNMSRVLVNSIKGVFKIENTQIVKSKYYKFYAKYIFPIENFITHCWDRLFAYQFIIVAEENKDSRIR